MRKTLVLLALLFIPAVAFSATIKVPADYPTIQQAIDAAAIGDTVLVSPGTYIENIDFTGKDITVTSSDGPAVTVIDGSQPSNYDYACVVRMISGEGPNAVLSGFTLTKGFGFYGAWGSYHGGGIYIADSDPTIRGNIVTGNEVTDSYSGGGGMSIWNCHGLITGNVIAANWAYYSAVGIDVESGSTATISDNVIVGNVLGADGFGGGGIGCNHSSPMIKNNLIYSNSSESTTKGSGGGISCWDSSPVIMNCTMVGNQVPFGRGGALYAGYQSYPVVMDSIFWNNNGGLGKEVALSTSPTDLIIDYTDLQGGLASCDPGGCNIIWGNNMMDLDPLFTDGPKGFHYLGQTAAGQPADSPCVDAGSDLASVLGLDMFWTRTDGVADAGTVDLGYHYGPFAYPVLQSHTSVISSSFGGMAKMILLAGMPNANRNYIILGSLSGTSPGTPLPGGMATLPLNWDIFTSLGIDLINTPAFANFMGPLDGNGAGSATFDTLGAIPSAAGLTLYFAFAVASPWDFVSNPVSIYLE